MAEDQDPQKEHISNNVHLHEYVSDCILGIFVYIQIRVALILGQKSTFLQRVTVNTMKPIWSKHRKNAHPSLNGTSRSTPTQGPGNLTEERTE